ncbi:UbiA family prenyltransferase [Actinocorallia longicatena]|uniref:UbiA family prenyltransferase n=1 Tax=Actinocorallia longicatena TaxID=111803 RepID=A0ABP6PWB3_9ACTN
MDIDSEEHGPARDDFRAPRLIRTLLLCWKEARPTVQVMCVLRVVAGSALARTPMTLHGATRVSTGVGSWVAASIAVYVFNGTRDLVEDRANGSMRPVASGALPVRAAEALVLCCTLVALAVPMVVEPFLLGPVTVLLVLGYFYSARPVTLKKSVAGAFVFGFCFSFCAFLVGWLTLQRSWPSAAAWTCMVALGVWTGLIGQTKDLGDREGDLLAGRRTLPILLTERGAQSLLAAAALALGFVTVGWALWRAPAVLPAALVLLVGGAAVAATSLGADPEGGRAVRRRPYRIFMATQYLAAGVIIVL